MTRFVCSMAVVVGLAVGCCGCRPAPPAADPASPFILPAGFEPTAGSGRDAQTGLPTRAVHADSGVTFVLVPAGQLVPGVGEPGHQRRRVVREPFYLGETEVTVGQFRRFADNTGYRTDAERGTPEGDYTTTGAFSELLLGKGDHREWLTTANWRNPLPNFAAVLGDQRLSADWPVVQVSWNDARRFAGQYGFRLPTEVQWEYACRAGAAGPFPWGEAAAGAGHANVGDAAFRRHMGLPDGGWPFDDGAVTLAKVGSYRPNAWGLYDMIGNVEEWCEDEYRSRIPEDLIDESPVVPKGPKPHHHVIRGGSWFSGERGCGSAERHSIVAEGRREWIGFRVAAAVVRVNR